MVTINCQQNEAVRITQMTWKTFWLHNLWGVTDFYIVADVCILLVTKTLTTMKKGVNYAL